MRPSLCWLPLNGIVDGAPVDILAAREAELDAVANLLPETRERIARRQDFTAWPGEKLWEALQEFDRQSSGKTMGDVNLVHAHDLIEALAGRDMPNADTICRLLTSAEVEGEWMEIFLIDLAGARRLREAVPTLVDEFRVDTDYMLERATAALSRIGDPEAVRLVREAFPHESWNFRLFTSPLLGRLKDRASEEAIIALLETEKEADIRTFLCDSLCDLFSRPGAEVVRREIEAGYDRNVTPLEERLLVVADVLGIALPEGERWRKEREEDERTRQERLAELTRRAMALKERGSGPREESDEDLGREPAERLEPIRRDDGKEGRNDPCPCGSGRKYKKCCGKPTGGIVERREPGAAEDSKGLSA